MPTRYFSDIHGVCPYNIIDSAAIAAKIGCTSAIQNNLPFILYCTRFALLCSYRCEDRLHLDNFKIIFHLFCIVLGLHYLCMEQSY